MNMLTIMLVFWACRVDAPDHCARITMTKEGTTLSCIVEAQPAIVEYLNAHPGVEQRGDFVCGPVRQPA
jgi:hypothetical protein